jgi:hypothetical protein
MTTTLAHTNGSAQGMKSWLKLSVQDFFREVNWDNRPLKLEVKAPVEPLASAATSLPSSLSLTMKVQEFFQAISWDGVQAIAAPLLTENVQETRTQDPDVTIDNFFDSF